jgi:hypothetical protein
VYHVNVFVNEDQKLTTREINLINITEEYCRRTKRLQSVQHFRVGIGSSAAGILFIDVVALVLFDAGET